MQETKETLGKILWRKAWQPYSCLETPIFRGAWRATVHSMAQSWIQLTHLSTHAQVIKTMKLTSVQ